ncbi:ABC transporter permease [Terriglobus albidus]|uniref:Transport permease protein n=1 Tax=Terriglobus albidus TaxID=1592106 RepID=A0A5B9ECX7_9BACT|nr:ABC transporter permease [Terriglobus albidus]QEE30068.1 ABC transporter permease [Terriglobus albidus]
MTTMTIAPRFPLYRKEAKYEFLRLLRARTFTLATIGFPLMFYLLFGVVNSRGHEVLSASKYLMATYSIFGLVGCSLFGISVTLSNERNLGWLEVKQASPMPAGAYLVAKLLTAFAFATIIFGLLLTLGLTMGHVVITGAEIRNLALTILGGVLPFASMGLMLAMVVPPQAAPGILNLIYLPMSFCSGLWMPLSVLPHWLQKVAPVWPTYHLAQIALGGIGFDRQGSVAGHVAALAGFTVLMLGLAMVLFRRNAAKS